MKIEINVVKDKYIMEMTNGDYQSTHVGTSISNCLDIAKKVISKRHYNGRMTFKVITHGYDANGAPITELVTEACG